MNPCCFTAQFWHIFTGKLFINVLHILELRSLVFTPFCPKLFMSLMLLLQQQQRNTALHNSCC